ncbi:MAG: transcriptional regulator [Solirubrobacterales bacterium]|nr:transcriptional regulator [Solirubrobacterales bacterium]
MPEAAMETPAGGEGARPERARLLTSMLEDLEPLTEAGVETICAEIPGYAEQAADPRFRADLTDQVSRHYRNNFSIHLEGRSVTLADIAFTRSAATRRARAGLNLEDYINAFRVGQQVLWESLLEHARGTPSGQRAALGMATEVMRYADFASTHAAHAYVEFQQYVVADADRERRDLLEHLLVGEMPTRGPLLAAAQSYGLGPETRMMVAAAVPAGQLSDAGTPDAASAAIARAGIREATTLVVVRQAEIVAVPALGPDGDPRRLCTHLESVQERLREEGMPLQMGISTVASGVAELPRAYGEARAALECIGDDGGVHALGRLSPFDYLALRGDETARRLVDPALRQFLDEDRARGGVMTATIRAFAEDDLNLRAAAQRLQIHPNTAQYRMRRIAERSGRNPRHISDLLDLLVAIALDDSEGTSG